jgi:hypothetical protein
MNYLNENNTMALKSIDSKLKSNKANCINYFLEKDFYALKLIQNKLNNEIDLSNDDGLLFIVVYYLGFGDAVYYLTYRETVEDSFLFLFKDKKSILNYLKNSPKKESNATLKSFPILKDLNHDKDISIKDLSIARIRFELEKSNSNNQLGVLYVSGKNDSTILSWTDGKSNMNEDDEDIYANFLVLQEEDGWVLRPAIVGPDRLDIKEWKSSKYHLRKFIGGKISDLKIQNLYLNVVEEIEIE